MSQHVNCRLKVVQEQDSLEPPGTKVKPEKVTPKAAFEDGADATIQGLANMPELNGTTCFVKGYDIASERFKVLLRSGEGKKLKLENLMFGDGFDDVSEFGEGDLE